MLSTDTLITLIGAPGETEQNSQASRRWGEWNLGAPETEPGFPLSVGPR